MFDPYSEWLGIPRDQRPVTCYQLLDVDAGETDPAVIQEAAEARAVLVSAHREGPNERICDRLLKEIDLACNVLLDPAKRQEYDERLRQKGRMPAAEAITEKPTKVAAAATGRGKKKASPERPTRKKRPAQKQGLPWLWIGVGCGVLSLFALAAGVVVVVVILGGKKPEAPASPGSVAEAATPKPEPAPAPVKKETPAPPPKPAEPKPAAPPSPAPAPPPPPPKPAAPRIVKLPVPDEAALAKALAAQKEHYKADYARKAPEDQLVLCARFLQPGRENRNDPAAWFVLLREARDLAVQVERPRLAIEAINELNRWFLIDAPGMKVEALTTLGKSDNKALLHSVMRTALAQVSQALDEDNGEGASRLIGIAEAAAAKCKADEDQLREIAVTREDVENFRKEYAAIAAAREKLKQTPADPAANVLAGKHLCFFHGRWDEGLPLLAKGNDKLLQGLAQKELARPEDPKVQTQLGDAWWLIGRQEKGRRELNLQARAMHWYERCEPKLAGANKTRVADRVKEVEEREKARIPRLFPGSFYGRGTEDRILLLRENGGTMRSEEAVEAGLKWLSLHQFPSGMWSMEGFHLTRQPNGERCTCTEQGEKHNVAATAFGLLPFLGVNETHLGGHYRETVRRGLSWLIRKQNQEKGYFDTNLYEHALATLAICEAYGLTRDAKLKLPAQAAMNYIIAAQNKQGSWGYTADAKTGDTSVTGWQFAALKAGVYAGLAVPNVVFNRVAAFLDTVADPNGLGYGYNTRGAARATSAVGLLCREFLGWRPRHPDLDKGVTQLLKPENWVSKERPSIYFLFYATQVMHHFGGKPWQEWNPKVRDLLVELQDQGTDTNHAHQKGSWSPRGDDYQKQGGRLMFTSLAILTLEQPYYTVPLNGYGPAVLRE